MDASAVDGTNPCLKDRAKTCMPRTRSLLQSIQSLHKAAEMLRTCMINKAWGLMHINLLLQNSMQKGILHIKLTKGPSSSNSQREQQTNGSGLDN
jgi:hypothetical protein